MPTSFLMVGCAKVIFIDLKIKLTINDAIIDKRM